MSFSWKEIERKAAQFSEEWAGVAYEKGESQTFYNEFFGIFNIKRRSVARFEEHVRKLDNKSGFVDLLWPKVLIVEHKSLGANLPSAANQAGDYFDALPEDMKPRYQMVCDFQRFSLLDRDTGQTVGFDLPDLHKNLRSFAFILGKQNSKHRVQEHLNVKAAELIAKIHRDLNSSGYSEKDLEFFLNQLVFCLFADNTSIFQPRGLFFDLVDSRTAPNGSDLGQMLIHLFQVLDTPVERRQKNLDLDLAEFPYINGGLFAERISIPSLNSTVRADVLAACAFDWSEVSPAIFGSLFQSVMTAKECRNIGAFATSEENIRKVLDDLVLTSLRNQLDALRCPGARRVERLNAFRKKLSEMNFLDPACGCGNFLVVAYRELRQIELEVLCELDHLGALEGEAAKRSMVDVDQLFGIELRSYSARIAVTALWMTDHIANNSLSSTLKTDFYRVPLTKSPNITIADALSLEWQTLLPFGECTCLFGNPPYKGPKNQNDQERKQVRELAALGGSGGTLDYACGWIIKAAEYAMVGVRVGLVVINSVVQGEQVGQLWPVLFERFSLEIEFAHQPFQWYSDNCGKPQVQVVILGLVRQSDAPNSRRLYEYETAKSAPSLVDCQRISPYLIVADQLDDAHAVVKEVSRPLNGFPRLKTGTKPIDGGYYILSEPERARLIAAEPGAESLIRPFVGTEEFLHCKTRYILVLPDVSANHLKSLPLIKKIIRKVIAYRKAEIPTKGGKAPLKNPNDLYRTPTRFHITVLPTQPFLVIPEVSSERRKYVPIGWLEPPTVPSNLVKVIEGGTRSHFALLTSAMHMAWLHSIGGHLEGRNRYSIDVVYNTFPVPKKLDTKRLVRAANAVLKARDVEAKKGNSLADMYDAELMPSALRKAHDDLDREVDRQYLGRGAKNNQERIIHLLNRYSNLPPQTSSC